MRAVSLDKNRTAIAPLYHTSVYFESVSLYLAWAYLNVPTVTKHLVYVETKAITVIPVIIICRPGVLMTDFSFRFFTKCGKNKSLHTFSSADLT